MGSYLLCLCLQYATLRRTGERKMMVFIPAHSISIKSGLCDGTFKFNHNHFATGAVGDGGKTLYNSRPIQTFLNDRVADCLYPGRYIDVPQSVLTREYFRTANSVDNHRQHSHGFSAIEIWRTKSCNQRVFQTVMVKGLVNRL